MDNRMKYYYVHPESDCVWWSFNDPEKTGNPDGCINEIYEDQAIKIAKEYGLEEVPYQDI